MFARIVTPSTTFFRLSSILRTSPPSSLNSVPIRLAAQISPLSPHPFSSPLTSISLSSTYLSSPHRSSDLPTTSTSITPVQSITKPNSFDALTNGQLVNDVIVSALLKERLSRSDCKLNGWILDGYPRTTEQAMQLINSDLTRPQLVIELISNRQHIQSRLQNRRRDPLTNKTYNINKLPSDPQIRSRLITRPDDSADVIQQRFRIYDETMPSIKTIFSSAAVPLVRIVTPINASPQQVFEKVSAVASTYNKIVLIGAPGCGKGTQGSLLEQSFSMVHVSTGDLLRNATSSVSTSTFVTKPQLKQSIA